MSEDEYMEIDALTNAIDFLHIAQQALLASDSSYRWKWATIGMANGLYGLMICALEGYNYANVMDFSTMKKDDREECRRLFVRGDPDSYSRALDLEDGFLNSRRAKLISFQEALRRVRDVDHMEWTTLPGDGPLDLSDKQVRSILQLWRNFRNTFEHFRPISLYIQIVQFPMLLSDVLLAIEQLDRNPNLWMTYGEKVEALHEVVRELRQAFDAAK